jgi:hypothetical protein
MSLPRLTTADKRALLKFEKSGSTLHLLRAYLVLRESTTPMKPEVLAPILKALDPIISGILSACESDDAAKDDRAFLGELRTALRIKGDNSPAKFKQAETRRVIEFMWYWAYLQINSGTAEFQSGRTIAETIAKELSVSVRTAQQVWKDAKNNKRVYAHLEAEAKARARGKILAR